MLNQLHTASDIAADHRRELLAEADAFRLARLAAAGPRNRPSAQGTRVTRFVRSLTRRATNTPVEAC